MGHLLLIIETDAIKHALWLVFKPYGWFIKHASISLEFLIYLEAL